MNREVHVRICESLVGRFRRATRPTVQVLKEPGRAATTTSQIWVQRAMDPEHPVVLFSYRASRSGATAAQLLGEFKGV
ncbi:MAG: transposase, partial [Arenicellales bacterium]|nr:transposase [Arenicellales bacterium]